MNVYFFEAEEWCNSCKAMKPSFNKVKDEIKDVTFIVMDVESDEGVDMSCKYQVRNVPQIIIEKNNKVVERIAGTRSYEQIKELVNKWK